MRIGLVLGGGGVSAQAFHAGVLAAAEDLGIFAAASAEIIVGTSAGSSTGALLRAGLTGTDLARRARGEPPDPRVGALLAAMGPPLDLAELRSRRRGFVTRPTSLRMLAGTMVRPWTARPGTVLAGLAPEGHVPSTVIAEPIDRIFRGAWPERPLWICAVRADNGRRVVFGRRGEGGHPTVGVAVSASCAVPGLYSPPIVDGVRYLDGGVWSASNADVLVGEALDGVIVSSPMTMSSRSGGRARDAAGRLFVRRYLLREVEQLRRDEIPVLLVEPTDADLAVMGTDMLDPARRAPVTDQVVASATARLRGGDLAAAVEELGLGA